MSGVSGGGAGGGVNRFVWARLGSVWWPGEIVDRRAFTDEMKAAFVPSSKGFMPHAIVKYFEEEFFSVIKKDTEMQVHALLDEKKKGDLIRKGMEKVTKAKNKEKFRKDVILMESEVAGRSKELTSVWYDNLLEKKNVEKQRAAAVKELFTKPEEKQRVRGQIVIAPAARTPQQNKAPPTPSPAKGSSSRPRFTCPKAGCSFSTERMGTLQSHAKSHTASPSTATISTPRKAGSSQLGKRSPRKASSPVKSHPPAKRGRPSGSGGKKEGKVPDTIKKEAILEGWSDAEEDEEDKIVVLGEEPPPTLKLFDTSTSSCVDEKSGALIKQEDAEAGSPGKKGPKTKKELADVFEELLRQTKPPEVEEIGKEKVRKEEKVEEVESSEVSSDEEMRDEVIMRTKTVKDDNVKELEEKKESETLNEVKEEEQKNEEEVEDKMEEEKDEEEEVKKEEDGVAMEVENITEDKVEKIEEDKVENQIEEEVAVVEKSIDEERTVSPTITDTEPEEEPKEEIEGSQESKGERVDPPKDTDSAEEELPAAVLSDPEPPSPGPPLLSAETEEGTQPPQPPTPTPASSSSLPPSSSDILESPRPPRPTAAVKPTTTTSVSPGGGIVSGGETVEDNMEKGAAVVQVQTASGSSGGGPPVLEPEQIVHVVPVENSDGTLTYMFLSVDQSSQARMTIDPTDHTAATLNGSEMDAVYIADKAADSNPTLYSALHQQAQGEEQQYVLLQQGSGMGGETSTWTLEQLQELLQANGLATSPPGGNMTGGSNPELGTTSGNE